MAAAAVNTLFTNSVNEFFLLSASIGRCRRALTTQTSPPLGTNANFLNPLLFCGCEIRRTCSHQGRENAPTNYRQFRVAINCRLVGRVSAASKLIDTEKHSMIINVP